MEKENNGFDFKFTELQNLLLNLSAGLPLENLYPDEIKMLEEKYGSDWMKVLEYTK